MNDDQRDDIRTRLVSMLVEEEKISDTFSGGEVREDSMREAKVYASHLETLLTTPSDVGPRVSQNLNSTMVNPSGSRDLLNPLVPVETPNLGNSSLSDRASSKENVLIQVEGLRFAQDRILELEDFLSRVRVENEQLTAAAETLRNRGDELAAKIEMSESRFHDKLSSVNDEKLILESQMKLRNKEISDLKLKIEELEMRLNTDLKRIRVRERELENRLELMKMENAAVVRSKDELILDLKRKIDQFSFEMENYRNKGKELNKRNEGQQDRIRRTVKALRLALSMLDGEDNEASPPKDAPLKKEA